jgi:hypothetical protein
LSAAGRREIAENCFVVPRALLADAPAAQWVPIVPAMARRSTFSAPQLAEVAQLVG